jgi:carboxypeptidase C (cathepsin A)
MNRLRAIISSTLIIVLSAALAVAEDPPRASPATTRAAATQAKDKSQQSSVAEKLSVTEHELKTGQTTLKYRTTAGTLPLKDESGKARASFFFVAYERIAATDTPVEARPITFVFNGGPGAAAIWLHIGTAGPKVVQLNEEGYPPRPPYRLIDNPDTWLTRTDLVFIDPVGTGFSRPAEGVKGEEFFGVRQDIDSVSEFIRLYLSRAGRWASPKFIAGESYGTTRAALLADHLHDRFGIALNGVIFISTVHNFGTLSAGNGNDLPYPLFLPTYTAAASYHKKLGGEIASADLPKLLKEVERWATDVYTPALAKGKALPADQRKQVVATLAKYTGLTDQYVDRADLRVSPFEFEKQLLQGQGKILGRFDSRIVGEGLEHNRQAPEYDPSLSLYVGVYSSNFNDYVRRTLNFESDLVYEYLTGRVQPWNWGQQGNSGYLYVADDLNAAMVKNPYLKVMFASGWYDLATPYFATDYTVNHLNLSPERRRNVRQTYYPGGHMMYHHQESRQKLNRDVISFMEWALGESTAKGE